MWLLVIHVYVSSQPLTVRTYGHGHYMGDARETICNISFAFF